MEGLYYYTDEAQKHMQLLRFYFDGLVLGAGLEGTVNDIPEILKWFNREQFLKSPHRNYGQFKMSKSQYIHFDLESSFGKIVYTGELNESGHISLISHSHINGYTTQVIYSPVPKEFMTITE
ncbi:MAG: hypothetical protein GY810_29680 [Aureispira sp.]|nr:hypothetical protein [Aureispira sp.]